MTETTFQGATQSNQRSRAQNDYILNKGACERISLYPNPSMCIYLISIYLLISHSTNSHWQPSMCQKLGKSIKRQQLSSHVTTSKYQVFMAIFINKLISYQRCWNFTNQHYAFSLLLLCYQSCFPGGKKKYSPRFLRNGYFILNGLGSVEVLKSVKTNIALCWQVPQVQIIVLPFYHILQSLGMHSDIKRLEFASFF